MANSGVSILTFLLSLASIFAWTCSRFVPSHRQAETTFDVMNFGAVGDGHTDDSQAFLGAWASACRSTTSSTLSIPDKTFLLNPVKFSGPCRSSKITVEISGKVTAPSEASEWKASGTDSWIEFNSVDGLIITGSETAQVDGRGLSWWNCKRKNKCSNLPNTMVIARARELHMNGLKFIDSPRMHLVIKYSSRVHVSNVNIVAHGDSPNTDGIHVSNSDHVVIRDSIIGTGDDCISIETGSSHVVITGIKCGPGHGISIGSLGDYSSEAQVREVHVSNCQFNGTTNGARIKTWQGGSGFARGISFENITMNSVDNPIVIDQYYCDHEGHKVCKNQTSAVQVRDVKFSRISGSSNTKVAIHLACSRTVPCQDIFLEEIHLRRTNPGEKTVSFCDSVHGTATSVEPVVECLLH